MRHIFLSIFYFFVFHILPAQTNQPHRISTAKTWDFHVGLNNLLLADDYILGTHFGITNANRNLSFFTEFDIRPYKKKVLDRQFGNYYYQLSELRYYLGFGGEYSLYKKDGNIGFFVQPSLLYTWGEYSGTEISVPKGLMILPKFGIVWQFLPNGFMKAGVAYLDDHTERENQATFFLQITGLIKRTYE